MATDALSLNRAVVFGSAVVYWAGVWVQARRIRRRIGRSTNSRPRGPKERLLWAGWFFVVAAWLALPFLCAGRPGAAAGDGDSPGSLFIRWLRALGITMVVAGYAGTLWCYVAMGNAWRMGVNRAEKTDARDARSLRFVRHPIYLFQVIMVAAIPLLLPSVLAFAILAIHVLCVLTKAADEESHLRTLLGRTYEAYCARTGRWLPRLRHRPSTGTAVAGGGARLLETSRASTQMSIQNQSENQATSEPLSGKDRAGHGRNAGHWPGRRLEAGQRRQRRGHRLSQQPRGGGGGLRGHPAVGPAGARHASRCQRT